MNYQTGKRWERDLPPAGAGLLMPHTMEEAVERDAEHQVGNGQAAKGER